MKKNYTEDLDKILLGEINQKQFLKTHNISKQRYYQLLKSNNIPLFKTCTKCNNKKKLIKFPLNRNKKHYRDSECKACKNKRETEKREREKRDYLEKNNLKSCSCCKQTKPIDEFYTNHRNCKKCHTEIVINYMKKTNYKYQRKWQIKNKEKIKENQNKLMLKHRTELRDSYVTLLLRSRRNGAIKPYNKNKEQYRDLIEKQKQKLILERQIKQEIN